MSALRLPLVRLVPHLLLWVAFAGLSWQYLAAWLPANGLPVAPGRLLLHQLLATPLLAAPIYLNYFGLLPRLYARGRYVAYGLVLALAFGLTSAGLAGLDGWFLRPAQPGWLYGATHLWSRLPYLVLFGLLANWVWFARALTRQRTQAAELRRAQAEAELRWLKAQVKPHFLFNALHNLYSLVYTRSELAAPVVVRLAEMMRYLFDYAQHERLATRHEVAYLESYVALHSLKKRWQAKIAFTVVNHQPDALIEPLLFINLLENAFVHGNLDDEGAFLRATLRIDATRVAFTVENTYAALSSGPAAGGVGLGNLRQRLALLYPGQHELHLSAEAGVYRARLVLTRPPVAAPPES